jgi:hypothetical protein
VPALQGRAAHPRRASLLSVLWRQLPGCRESSRCQAMPDSWRELRALAGGVDDDVAVEGGPDKREQRVRVDAARKQAAAALGFVRSPTSVVSASLGWATNRLGAPGCISTKGIRSNHGNVIILNLIQKGAHQSSTKPSEQLRREQRKPPP